MEQEEWIKRVSTLCEQLAGKGRASAFQTTELFLLHNEKVPTLFPTFEHGRSCGTCVARVYKRVSDYWYANIKDKA